MTPIEVKFIGKYIGPDKIVGISVLEFTTPLGSAVFEVELESGQRNIYPEKALVAISTEEVKDHNFIRDRRIALMIGPIVDILKEYDLPAAQFGYALQCVAGSINNEFDRALNYLWTKDDSRYVPGFESANDATLLMAGRVISVIPAKADEPKPTN